VIVDRDTKQPDVLRLAGGDYVRVEPDAEGWISAGGLGVRFRSVPGAPPRLEIRDMADPSLRHVI
jgi:hypothetical protein